MSKIEWTQKTWNPVTGCTRASRGCDHCYAVTMTHRLAGMGQTAKYGGLTVLNNRGDRHFNGVVRCHEDALSIPLARKKPTTWFVNSMSDLFHPEVPFDFIDKVFAVMALCPQHTFQVLTKRPERMAEYLEMGGARRNIPVYDAAAEMINGDWDRMPGSMAHERSGAVSWWPLRNVWLGTSCEDQAAADERVPQLLRCPAHVRFLSCEPLLGPVDLSDHPMGREYFAPGELPDEPLGRGCEGIDWVIVGGESGAGARACDVGWVRSIVRQCRDASVPVFVKQLGAKPVACAATAHTDDEWLVSWLDTGVAYRIEGPDADARIAFGLHDKKGGDPGEWPEDIRVREMPGEETERRRDEETECGEVRA